MTMSSLKLRSKQLLYKRVSEEPLVLSDCLQVTQKTILNHNKTSSKRSPKDSSACSSDLKSCHWKANNNANHHQPSHRILRQKCLAKPTFSRVPRTDSGGQFPCPVINVQIRKKRPSQCESNQYLHTSHLDLLSPRTTQIMSPSPRASSPSPKASSPSPRTPSPSPRTSSPSPRASSPSPRASSPSPRASSPSPGTSSPLPGTSSPSPGTSSPSPGTSSALPRTSSPSASKRRSSPSPRTSSPTQRTSQLNSPSSPPSPPSPRKPAASSQNSNKSQNPDSDKKDIENVKPNTSTFKRRSMMIRRSLINTKQNQRQKTETINSSPLKVSETKSTNTKEYIRNLSVLSKTYKADSVISVFESINSSGSRKHENSQKTSLWQIPQDVIKKHPEKRGLKRSKTSTGYYQDRKDILPPREAKSAGPQRCSTAPATPVQGLTDSECRTICQKLEDYLYNDNLPKFQEHLLPFSDNDKKRVIDFKETKTTANLFFRACGLAKMLFVKFMLEKCCPNVELKGPFFVGEDHTQYVVSPLWQAAASGNVELVQLLKENGADINATSDTGSSPLLAACYMSHIDVATFLVCNKANINACNAKGLTCLMNAVQSVDLVRLLVLNGAEINRTDNHGNTSMHFATEEGRLITVKILIELGGNPLLVNHDGYNVAQSAAKYRRRDVLEYLLQVVPLKVQDIVDLYEMIGAMVIMMEEDMDGGYLYLHKATTLRFLNKSNIIAKHTKPSILSESTNEKEFTILRELTDLANNSTKLCIQALMIYERQKGSSHEDFSNLMLYCGATFADHSNFKEAANLWSLSYHLNFEKYIHGKDGPSDPFNHNSLKSLAFVVKLLFQWKRVCSQRQSLGENGESLTEKNFIISESNVRSVLRMSFLHSATAHLWLNDQNSMVRKRYNQPFCLLLRSAVCILFVYTESFSRSERNDNVWQFVKYAISLNPRGERNETFLHMCMSPLTLNQLDLDISNTGINWPSLTVINIVLILGGNPTDSDNNGNTPLHSAAILHKQGVLSDQNTILFSLLSKGAHADQVNNLGQTAYDLLDCKHSNRTNEILIHNSMSLKCFAARAITAFGIQYIGEIPTSLYSFVELHRSIHVPRKISSVEATTLEIKQ